MSALVSITICHEGHLHRFVDVADADAFLNRRRNLATTTSRPPAKPVKAVRRHGENMRCMLRAIETAGEASTTDIAAAIERSTDVVNECVERALRPQPLIHVVRRGARGKRWFALTEAGRQELARHG